ncbi:type I restriction-modification system, S subunit [Xanthomonas oryzae pv. oryzicola BLS256]|uniref:Type I restriction-modification system, S subunit n=1 Tax=Xanthomonas oryzae pv. oryzicola (strain BLS256) TaxID=383407 RepID=G7TGM7_XANOB|nr:restriction endonuclease subunit S [Xanthomonas oryzae]AEQ95421.1 type I restriction-modification system, S subunit [Xanthomonas oryzae pv. oryzicola BLS256]
MTALLTGNLPLLAGAPNGIKKLRELILELAVRGKLVPQDASDEPASELLKRIALEKEKLSPEVKRPSETPVCAGAFELPESWCWARFGDIAQHNSGKTLDKGRNSGVPRDYITTSNLYWGRFELSGVRQMLIEEKDLARCTAIMNDLLICEGGEAGRAAVWDQEREICFQNHVHRARFLGGINPHYAQRFFERLNYSGEIAEYRKGVGISNMSSKSLASIPVPLPPVAEQHRIVAKVDELMGLCDQMEARQADADSAHAQLVQALLDSLTQARDAEDFAHSWQRLAEHFHTLFTTESSIDALKQTLLQLAVMGKLVQQDPNDETGCELLKRIAEGGSALIASKKVKTSKAHTGLAVQGIKGVRLPATWAWARFDDLINREYPIAYGVLVPGPDVVDGIPFVRIADLDLVAPPAKPEKSISPEVDSQFKRTRIRGGEILMGVVGSVGKLGIAPDTWVGANIARAICRIVPCGEVSKSYILWLLQSDLMRKQFLGDTRTLAQPTLNVGLIRSALTPLPPLAEQQRIVAKVDQLMALCDQLKSRLSEARRVHEHLANALISQALNGEKKSGAEVVDFSAYLISKLAPQRTFGRVAHMKLLFLADSHLGLGLMDGYRRHAAGPLDTTIYRVEERAAKEGLYSTSIEVLKSGQEKVSYHIGANISRAVETAASALGSARKELDRLIALFEGRKTDDLEAVATLYAVWNDALAGGLHPSDEWLINEFRSNWHEAKERFTPDVLGRWLGWMRDNGLVPTGNSATTKSQAAFLFN